MAAPSGSKAGYDPTWRLWLGVIVLGLACFVLPIMAIAMPESLRIPIVKAHGQGDPAQAALFSHGSHRRYACYSCHPSIFPQVPKGFTHEDMDAGKYCARCHNDKVTWSIDHPDTECETCHRE